MQYSINFADGRLCEADFCEFVAEVVMLSIASDEEANNFFKCLHDSIIVSSFTVKCVILTVSRLILESFVLDLHNILQLGL